MAGYSWVIHGVPECTVCPTSARETADIHPPRPRLMTQEGGLQLQVLEHSSRSLACHKEQINNYSICGGFRATYIKSPKDERVRYP
jgi:hypothetical protein